MEHKSCMLAIKNNYDNLTNVEKKIADFVSNNRDKIVGLSIGELAKKSEVAKSAVIRCCKSLGFEGYSDFKIALAMELSKNKQLNYAPYIEKEDDAGAILDKIFSANVKTLHDTAEKIDREVLGKVVNLLAKANAIYIYAIGTSSAIASDFQYRLMQLGYMSFFFNDVPAMKVSTMNIKPGDVAIGISHSGRTVATVDALKRAKEQGAKTVCITSYPESEITKICDYPIEIYSDEIQYPMEAISARIAHMSVTDALAVALSSENYEEAEKRAKKIYELVNTVRF